MGHRRLRPDLRHLPHHRRTAGRPARPPAHVLARPGRSSRWRRRPAAWRRARPCSSARASCRGWPPALLSPQVLSIIGVVYSGPDRVRAISIYGIVLGLRRRRRPAHRRRPRAGRHRRPGLAQLLPHQRPGRPRRADGRRARGARVARRGRPPPGPRRDRADHARPRRHRPAARRGPPARLAGVDVAVPGRRPDHPRPLRRPPAAPEPPRRRAAARSRAVPRARVQRGPRDPARVLLEHGLVLPRARAVPAAGPRARRAAGRAGLHDPGRRLPGRLGLRAGPDPAPGPAAAGHRRARPGRRARAAGAERGRHRRRRLDRPARARACCSRAPAWASSSRR